ncbi:MAG: Dam family site-specific DNA-(adenine-N6)-methyltransferase [Emergencia sp.]|nr:Dam family site-specific DNA-(adenine-N6)-methyltransferase [Emergencia sp.]
MFRDVWRNNVRYIGSKVALLDSIEYVIKENTSGNEKIFCDLFSGTASVAKHFKNKYEVISNDFMYFSYVLQKATIENNHIPDFKKLKKIGIQDPFKFLEESTCNKVEENYFITRNYSPYGETHRMYVSVQNAMRIDYIRSTIEAWKNENLLNQDEYFYLLASLIEGVPFVSNITGTYGAYLKNWDKRAYKNFEMIRLDVENNGHRNKCYNRDASELILEISGDILYLDPPYNSRQYAPNYHLLETISRYDAPKIKGVTGMRNYDKQKSAFCIKKDVANAFEDIMKKADFEHIVLSYSSEGIMSFSEIEEIMKKYGIAETYKKYNIQYRKYKSKINNEEKILYEYLFYIRKEVQREKPMLIAENTISYNYKSRMKPSNKNKKFIKSPLNYIGGKYKLLPQIMPLFPKDINLFIDLFSGGGNVGINAEADKILCNDINTKIIELFNTFKNRSTEEVLKQIDLNIQKYSLSKTNEEGFLRFRKDYNKTPDPIDLYTLTCYSFNYQFRFNNSHEYNNPFGRNRSQFSERMRNNLISVMNRIREIDIIFSSKDFMELDLTTLGPQDFVYCDPPYLITTGSYNDGNRGFKDWGEEEEADLYNLLDYLNKKNIKFALSNVLSHKGQINKSLLEWSKKYHVIHLNYNYINSSYNTKRGESDEVLIINY